MSAIYEVNLKNPVVEQGWRGIAWSPMGCTSAGGCLLAGLSSDFKVRVLAPPASSLGSTWQEAADVTALLQRTMAASDWAEVDCLAAGSVDGSATGGAAGALRLRGGCTAGQSGSDSDASPSRPHRGAGHPARLRPSAPLGQHAGGQDRGFQGPVASAVLRLRGGGPAKRRTPGAGRDASGSAAAAAAAPPSNPTSTADGAAGGATSRPAAAPGVEVKEEPKPAGQSRPATGTTVDGGASGSGSAAQPSGAAKAAGPAPVPSGPGGDAGATAGDADGGEGEDGGPAKKRARVAADAGGSSAADPGAAKAAPGAGGAAKRLQGIRAGLPKGPAAASGAAGDGRAHGVQLREGDAVEVHNAEEGLVGAWFPARLIRLSAPQYGYGLVEYDDLQVSEAADSPKLTEWFPLPGCPRLLTPATARAAIPADVGPSGEPYPVHCRRGYAVRPMPPSQLAVTPLPPPFRLGLNVEVLHDGAWWSAKLVEVTGPPDKVAAAATVGRAAAATGRQLAAAATAATAAADGAGGVGGSSGNGGAGVVVRVELLDATEEICVPLERTRAAVAWDERAGTWSAAPGPAAASARPPHFRDVMLLTGGAAAAAALEPAFTQRVESLRAAAAAGGGMGGEEEEEGEDEGQAWAVAVESAGQEMLRVFALEFRLLRLDGSWLWLAVRRSLAALQGATHPDQLPRPSWAAEQPTAAGGMSPAAAAAAARAAAVASAAPEGKGGGGAEAGTAKKKTPGTAGGAGRRGRASKAADGAAAEPLDFSSLDPCTFHPYDTRTDKDEGGESLEKVASNMVVKRFSALLAAADPATLRAFIPGERLSGTELRLYERALGEFMHLYGSKLPEGAAKKISNYTRTRARALVRTAKADADADAVPTPGNRDEPRPGAGAGAGADEDGDSADGDADAAGATEPGGLKKRRRTGSLAAGLAAAGAGAGDGDVKEDGGEGDAAAMSAKGASTAKKKTPGTAAGPGRRGRASKAADGAAAEPLDFSSLDPLTFQQYDMRADRNESGESLERAAAAMIVKRWQALILAADPATLRAYQPGEHVTGMELQLYEQAYGEFVHLYGSKLREGAAKRLRTESKRRVRNLVRPPAKATPMPSRVPPTDQDDEDEEDGDGGGGGGGDTEGGGGTGGAALHTSGRRARAAAVRAAAATRNQVVGADADAEEEGPAGPRPASGARGRRSSTAAGGGRGRGGKRRVIIDDEGDGDDDEQEEDADDASDFSPGKEGAAEEASGDSSGDESLEDEGDGDGEEGDAAEESDGDLATEDGEELGDAGGSGRRGRGGRAGGSGRGRGRPRGALTGSGRSAKHAGDKPKYRNLKEEAEAARQAAAEAIAAASVATFAEDAPALMNWEEPASLHKHGPGLIYRRFLALRAKLDEVETPSYSRFEKLRGPDLAAYVQAMGEYMKVAGGRLSGDSEKKIQQTVKAMIRKHFIHPRAAEAAAASGAARGTGGTAAAGGSSADPGKGPGTQLLWLGKRRLGVREAAGIQGTLFMGYGDEAQAPAPGPDGDGGAAEDDKPEEGGAGGTSSQQRQAASGSVGGNGVAEAAAVAAVVVPKETWRTTVSCIGQRPNPRYAVSLVHGPRQAAPVGKAPPPSAPSYAVRFCGVARDDHRSQPLDRCNAEVSSGPALPTLVYEARSLALAATCLSWSPPFVSTQPPQPPHTTAAAPAPAAQERDPGGAAAAAARAPPAGAARASGGAADRGPAAAGPSPSPSPQSDGVSRSCVLAVGNKLGQVALWRLDLPPRYATKATAGAASGSGGAAGGEARAPASLGPSAAAPVALHWMGALRVHCGGAHVLRTAWMVAPEAAAPAAAPMQDEAAGGEGAVQEGWQQWRVPQPHSAGPRDGLLLLTGLSDGSILLWSVPASSFRSAASLSLVAQICPADGLALTSLDCTWLLATDTRGVTPAGGAASPRRASGPGGAGAGGGDGDNDAGAVGAAAKKVDAMEVNGAAAAGTATPVKQEAGPEQPAGVGPDRTAKREEEAAAAGSPEAPPPAAGPSGRQILVAASKPCGSIFVWRSGWWLPNTSTGSGIAAAAGLQDEAVGGTQAAEAEVERDVVSYSCAADLAEACTTARGAASCLLRAAHGTGHASAVAVARGQPLVVSGGMDGAVKCWTVSELRLPQPPPKAQGAPRRSPSPPVPLALTLEEVPDGLSRLDPASAGLPALPRQVRALSLSRQAVHGIAASGNGLLFAVLRTTSSRQLDMARNVMIHGRVLGASVHLLTPYGMELEATGFAEAANTAGGMDLTPQAPAPAAAAAAAGRLRLPAPAPGQLAAGLLFQAPTAACIWDVYALALRAGLVAAAGLPQVPADAWTDHHLGEASAAEDAAALEQVQGTEEGDDGGGAGGGNIDLGRARLAALVRLDAEERRRAKITTRLQHLTAVAVMAAALNRFVAPLEASYLAAAAKCAAAAADDQGTAADGAAAPAAANSSSSIYTLMRGPLAWGWCGLRCATALRRMALSYACTRSDTPGASPYDLLAEVDGGVVEELRRAGGASAAALAAPPLLSASREAAARNELELLQAHVWNTLTHGIEYCTGPRSGAGVAAGATLAGAAKERPALHCLLMSDWVCAHIEDSKLRATELLMAAAPTYVAADEEPPLSCTPPGREEVPLAPGRSVGLSAKEGMLESAALAEIPLGGAGGRGSGGGGGGTVLTLPRCGATMALCGVAPGVWNCVVCDRRYMVAPTRHPLQPASPAVPFCLFCSVRLSSGAPGDNFIRQPSLPAGSWPGGSLTGEWGRSGDTAMRG